MSRIVDLDDERNVFCGCDGEYEKWNIDPDTIEERKTGKWEIYVISPFDGEGCRCSECKYEGAPYWDFCPNCGVVMNGGKNG